MLRVRAVRELLFEVAGLRHRLPDDPLEPGEGGVETLEERRREDQREEIARARRRALWVVVLDAFALLALIALRDPARGLVVVGRTEEMVFTVGILAIAGHLGFRLAQLVVLRNLERACDELPE